MTAVRRRSRPSLSPTERAHPRSEDLDRRSTLDVVRRLHEEDTAAVRAVGRVSRQVARAAELAAEALRQGGRLIYVGAGTSGRLGVLDAAECPPTFSARPGQVRALIAGGRAALTNAVEGAEDDREAGRQAVRDAAVSERDLVFGISASATTPFVLGALQEARRLGARTALFCCNPRARAAFVDVLIAPDTGPELIAGSTRLKAGTATKLVLNAVSTAAMVALGKVYRGRMVDLQPKNRKLRERAQRMVAELAGLPPREAASLLRRAGGSPKVALAMHLTGLDRPAAERALRSAGGLRPLERRRR